MKYIKTYEAIQDPQLYDYVICNENTEIKELNDFVNSKIGQIINIPYSEGITYLIQYENVPESISPYLNHFMNRKNVRKMFRAEIIYYSKDKEYLKTLLISNKYNI